MKIDIIEKLIDDRIQLTTHVGLLGIEEDDNTIRIRIYTHEIIVIQKSNILYMSGITIVKVDNELIK